MGLNDYDALILYQEGLKEKHNIIASYRAELIMWTNYQLDDSKKARKLFKRRQKGLDVIETYLKKERMNYQRIMMYRDGILTDEIIVKKGKQKNG